LRRLNHIWRYKYSYIGYKKFKGDSIFPLKISRQYSGLIAHYGIRFQAKIYKIDSWNNENLFVMVDNFAVRTYLFGQTNSSTEICGDPNPVFDSINTNYKDSILIVDLNITHNSNILDVSF